MFAKTSLTIAAIMGCAALGNGCYMLVAPLNWYLTVPGVPMSGHFNPHFIRDIGVVFLLIGFAFLAGMRGPGRALLWSAATVWLLCHALLHLWEVLAGIADASAIARDFAPVTLPALLGLCISFWAFRAQNHRATPAPAMA